MNCKFEKREHQVSYDGGETWQTTEIIKGDLIEYDSQDCNGYIERWVVNGYICEDSNKYYREVLQYSNDNGMTWYYSSPLIVRIGDFIAIDEEFCDNKFEGHYEFGIYDPLKIVKCGNNTELTKDDVYHDTVYDRYNHGFPYFNLIEGVIGDCVTSIGNSAFSGCTSLSSVTIPNSVTSIGRQAFCQCTSLSSVAIPNSVTSISEQTFSGCTSLSSVTIPNSVTSIEYEAFQNAGLVNLYIPSSVTSIGNYAFWHCTSLTSIDIPSGVTSIDNTVFLQCGNLSNISVSDENTVYDSRNHCNAIIESNTNKLIKGSNTTVIPNTVTSIGERAFQYCSGLTSIDIPDSVTSIEDWAFTDCYSLSNVTIPNSVTSINYGTFHSCYSLSSITIPNSVTSIGNMVFSDSGLRNIEIPSGVTSIGYSAFARCSSLTSCTIGSGVTSIGDRAFYNCDSLLSVTIEAINPPTLGSNVFNSMSAGHDYPIYVPCESLDVYKAAWGGYASRIRCKQKLSMTLDDSSIVSYDCNVSSTTITNAEVQEYSATVVSAVVGDCVTTIGYHAFYGCSNLTSVTISDSVTSIGSSAFEYCSGLTRITIDATTPPSIDGAVFSYTSNCPIFVPKDCVDTYKAAWSQYADRIFYYSDYYKLTLILRDTSYVLYECESSSSSINRSEIQPYSATVVTIEIGDCVTSIGDYAFTDCRSLPSYNIPDSVTSIGNYVFQNCSGLTSIDIPDSVTSIGDYAFSSCGGLTRINLGSGLTSIGSRAFSQCTSLTNIDIPNSVTSIGDYAFTYCTNLSSIEIPNGVTSINGGTFDSCWSLSSVTIPNSVTSIGSSAFGYSGLKSINIPSGVTSIGDNAFRNCNSITSIDIPDSVTSIGSGAFEYCNYLESIKLSNSITRIESYTFRYCFRRYGYSSITIPRGVTYIGQDAFYGCSGLTSITVNAITPPTLYNGNVFYGTNFEAIYVPCESIDAYKAKRGWSDFASIIKCKEKFSLTLNDSSIVSYDCESSESSITRSEVQPYSATVVSVNIYDICVTSIGDNAFEGCSNLTSVTIPDSVTSIGSGAFEYCSGLTRITADSTTPPTLGNNVFDNTNNCPIYVPSGSVDTYKAAWSQYADRIFYYGDCHKLTLMLRNTSYVSYDCESLSSSIESGEVKSYSATVVSAEIGNCVTSIGYNAFRGCSSLSSVTIGNSVISIGGLSFINCSGLTSITIPNRVEYIGDNAFQGCSGLTSINIPNAVTSINYGTFQYCTSLTSIDIPSGVTSIGNFAFTNCRSLTSIDIPNSVTSIGNYVFSNCRSLTSVTIGNGVTSFGTMAFANCSGLTSIDIPSGVTSIGTEVFYRCSGLTSVTVNAIIPPTLSTGVFSYTSEDLKIYVPSGSVDAYKAADNWSTYADRIQAIPNT